MVGGQNQAKKCANGLQGGPQFLRATGRCLKQLSISKIHIPTNGAHKALLIPTSQVRKVLMLPSYENVRLLFTFDTRVLFPKATSLISFSFAQYTTDYLLLKLALSLPNTRSKQMTALSRASTSIGCLPLALLATTGDTYATARRFTPLAS